MIRSDLNDSRANRAAALKLAFPRITIIDRYVALEVLLPFAMGVGLLTFTLVTGRMLKLTEMVVNHGVSVGEVLGLIAYIMPAFLELTLGMAVLLGVLLGFGRMSNDQEMTAARASGISLYRLAVPVMAVAFVVYLVATWFAFSVRPWADSRLQDQLYYLTRTKAAAGLREKVFNDDLPRIMIYVDKISDEDGSLHGVMIADSRDPKQQNTIIATHGLVLPDEKTGGTTLRLFDGSLFGSEAASDQSHVTSFRVYDLTIRPKEGGAASLDRDADELSYGALIARIDAARARGKPDHEAETELAAKYMVPFATLLFALLGVSLGLKPARGGHSERFGVAVALFFLYYSIMRVGRTLAERGSLNAYLAMSIPDVVFLALALWLFVRAAQDKGNQGRGPGDFLWELVERYEKSRQPA
ncbi:MAG TPA: LPS export ABC transporter permease LptF [Candidatus Binataceae bacterium]|nr:LPS export ABC transporter permease LptF [Candidatus Binataceae bacterium]